MLGLDGATWTLVDQWLEDLPNISRLIEEGIKGDLESVTPPVTSPAWRCYATGKDPNDIGVYWWRQLDRDNSEFLGADQIPLTDECFWTRLSDSGNKVAIIGVPLNSPPQEVNGHFIAGGPFADPDNYTYPESLTETLEEQFDYQLHPQEYPSVDTATDPHIVDDFESMIDQRFDVAEWLLTEHDPGFLNLTLFYLNVMQHKAWDAPEVKQLWETIDRRLGELLSDDTDLIIHSDHGLHEVRRVFYINTWLEKQGYLSVAEPDNERSVTDTIRSITDRMGISEYVSHILPDRIRERLDSGRRLIDSEDYESRIKFEESQAIGLPQGPVYGLTDSEDVIDELAAELRAVVDPDSGQKVFDTITPTEEIYENPLREDAPDLLVKWNDGFEIKNQHSEDEEMMFGPPYGVLADNAPMGILIASGPSFDKGSVDAPMLYDIAPTILHLLNEPVPNDMTGSVIKSLYDPMSDAAEREIETVAADQIIKTDHTSANQDVNDRLQDLGYLE